MRRPSDKKHIIILQKSLNNQTLRDFLHRKYGRRYAVSFVDSKEVPDGKTPKMDPSKIALFIIPGYGCRNWFPPSKVIDGFMDYVEAGGNMLVICDSIHEFVHKGWAIMPDEEEAGDLGVFRIEGFDKGNGRIPEHIEYIRVRTKEADGLRSARTLVGPSEEAARTRLTSVYRARGDCFFLRGDFDKERILPFGEVDRSEQFGNGGNLLKGKSLFNFLYVRQGKGNIVFAADHNEEDIGRFLNYCLLYCIKQAICAKVGLPAPPPSECKGAINDFLYAKASYLRDVRPHRKFNEEFRSFVYEDILGLEAPRGGRGRLDPALGAIRERIENMRGRAGL